MEKLYTSKTILKMAGGRMHTSHSNSWISHWPYATETIKRVWHALVTSHHQFCSFFTKRQSQKGGRMAQRPYSECAPGHKHIGYWSNFFEILFFHPQYFVFSLKTSLKTSG